MNIPDEMTDDELAQYITPQRPRFLDDYFFVFMSEEDEGARWSGQVWKTKDDGVKLPIVGVNKEAESNCTFVTITCVKDRDDFFESARLAYDDAVEHQDRAVAYIEIRDLGIQVPGLVMLK